ncbi:MAG: IS200/IS605 family element transposase accessory protein TnpB [Candidatus Lokiarchaeota archaeon]|nr:IS200/IS605 family element transposase accessory protein TnpB [Candidatus Lokiarchaeota archaeon]
MYLTEQIQINPSNQLSNLCHIAKNLYNQANYIIRQDFFNNKNWTRYGELYHLLKGSDNYKQLPAQSAQQVLKIVDKNWKSFFISIKDWKQHPDKYQDMPHIPHYKKKAGEFLVIFTKQQIRVKDNRIVFPKKAKLPPIFSRILDKIKQIRIIPRGIKYFLEIVYEVLPKNLELDHNRIIGIDLGLENLVTIANNAGLEPFIVKGGAVKSINQYYNKKKAKIISIKDLQEYKFQTKRLKRLNLKRYNKIRDYFHKVSRKIVDYCIEHNFGTIVIGYNKSWKQQIKIGKRNNQNFVTVPFLKLVQMIQYKAELISISVLLIPENHTSKCSFFDDETIEHHDIYLGRRITRGLFRTSGGRIINADVNAAYNIIKKAVPDAFNLLKADGIEGAVGHPYPIRVEGSNYIS